MREVILSSNHTKLQQNGHQTNSIASNGVQQLACDIDVVVVGAGVAGLTAAQALWQAGVKVLVVEGRSRLGGRLHTSYDIHPDVGIDLGGAWIHGLGNPQTGINPMYAIACKQGWDMVHTDYDDRKVYVANPPCGTPSLHAAKLAKDIHACCSSNTSRFLSMNQAPGVNTKTAAHAVALCTSGSHTPAAQKYAAMPHSHVSQLEAVYRQVEWECREWAATDAHARQHMSIQDVTDMVLQRHAADLPPYIAELLHWEVHSQLEHYYAAAAADMSLSTLDERRFQGIDVLLPQGYGQVINVLAEGMTVSQNAVTHNSTELKPDEATAAVVDVDASGIAYSIDGVANAVGNQQHAATEMAGFSRSTKVASSRQSTVPPPVILTGWTVQCIEHAPGHVVLTCIPTASCKPAMLEAHNSPAAVYDSVGTNQDLAAKLVFESSTHDNLAGNTDCSAELPSVVVVNDEHAGMSGRLDAWLQLAADDTVEHECEAEQICLWEISEVPIATPRQAMSHPRTLALRVASETATLSQSPACSSGLTLSSLISTDDSVSGVSRHWQSLSSTTQRSGLRGSDQDCVCVDPTASAHIGSACSDKGTFPGSDVWSTEGSSNDSSGTLAETASRPAAWDPRFPAACFLSHTTCSSMQDFASSQPSSSDSSGPICTSTTAIENTLVEVSSESTDAALPHPCCHDPERTQQGQQRQLRITAKRAVLTLPLGVLKSGNVSFSPPLQAVAPQKQQAIDCLGAGIYDKVVLRFPDDCPVFWDDVLLINRVPVAGKEEPTHWCWFLNLYKVMGVKILIAFNVADFAISLEQLPDHEVVARALTALRGLYGAEAVPQPEASAVTRWGADPMSRMSYTFIPVGATTDMCETLRAPITAAAYEAMKQQQDHCNSQLASLEAGREHAVENLIGETSLHWAGEATSQHFYATVHGAYETGLRAAKEIVQQLSNAKPQLAQPAARLDYSSVGCFEALPGDQLLQGYPETTDEMEFCAGSIRGNPTSDPINHDSSAAVHDGLPANREVRWSGTDTGNVVLMATTDKVTDADDGVASNSGKMLELPSVLIPPVTVVDYQAIETIFSQHASIHT